MDMKLFSIKVANVLTYKLQVLSVPETVRWSWAYLEPGNYRWFNKLR